MEKDRINQKAEEEKAYRYWLHNLPGVGDKTIERLLRVFGSAGEIYKADVKELRQVVKEKRAQAIKIFSQSWNVEANYEALKEKKIQFISREEKQYPERLKKLAAPPYAIYCLGSLPSEKAPAAAIIGARECSEYGRSMARAFAGKMAEAGVTVISGMARGIDGIAQAAAIQKGGNTYAVLGCGADVCYPASNQELYQKILETGGGILSPFPPGRPPFKQQFPERNRIVAGFSDMLLVVEARLKSGTWITVDMALEQGKSVYAIPGRLTDRLSDGCNYLIRQGAGIALTPDDILQELAVLQNREGGKKEKEEKAEGLLAFLDSYPKAADEILLQMEKKGQHMELPCLLEKLIGLCMENKAKQVAGSYFIKILPEDFTL